MEIIIFILLILLAVAFLAYYLPRILKSSCPYCQDEKDEDITLFPVIPLGRWGKWFCPNCFNMVDNDKIRERSVEDDDE